MPLDHSKNPFELYQNTPGWKEASIDIEAVIIMSRRRYQNGVEPHLAYKEVTDVLHKYSPWGAEDTEPCEHAAALFCDRTDLNPDEFYFG